MPNIFREKVEELVLPAIRARKNPNATGNALDAALGKSLDRSAFKTSLLKGRLPVSKMGNGFMDMLHTVHQLDQRKKLVDNFVQEVHQVKVYLRLRPLRGKELKATKYAPIWDVTQKSITFADIQRPTAQTSQYLQLSAYDMDFRDTFHFAEIFDALTRNPRVLQFFRNELTAFIFGVNVGVVLYGGRGTGKSYTAFGPPHLRRGGVAALGFVNEDENELLSNPETLGKSSGVQKDKLQKGSRDKHEKSERVDTGLAQLILQEVCSFVVSEAHDHGWDMSLVISMFAITKDNVYDLLTEVLEPLESNESPKEHKIKSPTHGAALLARGLDRLDEIKHSVNVVLRYFLRRVSWDVRTHSWETFYSSFTIIELAHIAETHISLSDPNWRKKLQRSKYGVLPLFVGRHEGAEDVDAGFEAAVRNSMLSSLIASMFTGNIITSVICTASVYPIDAETTHATLRFGRDAREYFTRPTIDKIPGRYLKPVGGRDLANMLGRLPTRRKGIDAIEEKIKKRLSKPKGFEAFPEDLTYESIRKEKFDKHVPPSGPEMVRLHSTAPSESTSSRPATSSSRPATSSSRPATSASFSPTKSRSNRRSHGAHDRPHTSHASLHSGRSLHVRAARGDSSFAPKYRLPTPTLPEEEDDTLRAYVERRPWSAAGAFADVDNSETLDPYTGKRLPQIQSFEVPPSDAEGFSLGDFLLDNPLDSITQGSTRPQTAKSAGYSSEWSFASTDPASLFGDTGLAESGFFKLYNTAEADELGIQAAVPTLTVTNDAVPGFEEDFVGTTFAKGLDENDPSAMFLELSNDERSAVNRQARAEDVLSKMGWRGLNSISPELDLGEDPSKVVKIRKRHQEIAFMEATGRRVKKRVYGVTTLDGVPKPPTARAKRNLQPMTKDAYELMKQRIVRMQANYRGALTRARLAKWRRAAIVIQRTYRMYVFHRIIMKYSTILRNYLIITREKIKFRRWRLEKRSSTLIQKNWRGYTTRMRLFTSRRYWGVLKRLLILKLRIRTKFGARRAAIILSGMCRMRRQLKAFRSLRAAAITLQKQFRMLVLRREYRRIVQAVQFVQARIGHRVRKRYFLVGKPRVMNLIMRNTDAVPTRNFSVFVSSTFTDTSEERNMLIKDVYPRLKNICRRYGFEFAAREMRWGIREEATQAHLTVETCLEEIARCQKESRGLAFFVILGDKCGFRPFPRLIEKSEFDTLLEYIKGFTISTMSTETRQLAVRTILQSYRLDENAVPPRYILLPTFELFPDYNSEIPEKRQMARAKWWESFELMQQAFRASAIARLTPERMSVYTHSVTGLEIATAVTHDVRAASKAFAVVRQIRGIDVKSPMAGSYIDVLKENGEQVLDAGSQRLLKNMKDGVTMKLGNAGKLKYYQIPWFECGVANEVPAHASYLKDFLRTFEGACMSSLMHIVRNEKYLTDDPHYEEVLSQHIVCRDLSQTCHGREILFDEILAYLESDVLRPFVVHGECGVGKTTVVARAAILARERFPKAKIVVRLLGTSPASSSAEHVLESCLIQLIRLTHAEDTDAVAASDRRALRKALNKICSSISETQKVLFFFDAPEAFARGASFSWAARLDWLPVVTPNVRIVLSVLTDSAPHKELVSSVRAEGFHELKKFTPTEIRTTLNAWLAANRRKLSVKQHDYVIGVAEHCPLPLFLAIAFDMCKAWTSYDDPKSTELGGTIELLIDQLLRGLKRKHGTLLVSTGLGLLTVARNGLADNEIEDLLSCDDEVLNDVFEWWVPPVRRLPSLLWVRLRADLSNYLVTHGQEAGFPIRHWYHTPFAEGVHRNFFTSAGRRAERHIAIAEYFRGRWAGIPKPYTDKHGQLQKADRLVAHQPIVLSWDVTAERTPVDTTVRAKAEASSVVSPDLFVNLRKLSMETYHLCRAHRWTQVTQFLTNINFIEMSVRSGRLLELLDDMRARELAGVTTSGPEKRQEMRKIQQVVEWRRFLSEQGHILSARPHLLMQQAYNFTDGAAPTDAAIRFLSSRKMKLAHRGAILRYINKASAIETKVGSMQGHEKTVTCFDFLRADTATASSSPKDVVATNKRQVTSEKSFRLISCSLDATLRVWEQVGNEEAERGYMEHSSSVSFAPKSVVKSVTGAGFNTLAISRDGLFLVASCTDATLTYYDVELLRPHYTVHMLDMPVMKVSDDEENESDTEEKNNGGLQVPSETDKPSGSFLERRRGAGGSARVLRLTCIAIHPLYHALVVVGDSEGNVRGLDFGDFAGAVMAGDVVPDDALPYLTQHLVAHKKEVTAVEFLTGGQYIASSSHDRSVMLWKSVTGRNEPGATLGKVEPICTYEYRSRVCALTFHEASSRLVGAGWNGEVFVWCFVAKGDAKPFLTLFKEITLSAVPLSINFNASGTRLACGCRDRTLRIVDASNAKTSAIIVAHTRSLTCARITPDGQFAISSDEEKEIRIFDVALAESVDMASHQEAEEAETDVLPRHVGGIWAVAYHEQSKLVATGGRDAVIRLWKTVTGQFKYGLTGHTSNICALKFSKSRLLVSAGWDRQIKIWDLMSRSCLRTLPGHSRNIWCLSLSPDNSVMVSGGEDKKVQGWSFPDGKQLFQLRGHQGWVRALDFSPTGQFLASGSSDYSIRVWDVERKAPIRMSKGHRSHVTAVLYVNVGQQLISSSTDMTIIVWNAANLTQQRTLIGHVGGISSIALSPSESYLISGSADQTVKIWDLRRGKYIAEFVNEYELLSVAAASHNQFCAADSAGRVMLLDIDMTKVILTSEAAALQFRRIVRVRLYVERFICAIKRRRREKREACWSEVMGSKY